MITSVQARFRYGYLHYKHNSLYFDSVLLFYLLETEQNLQIKECVEPQYALGTIYSCLPNQHKMQPDSILCTLPTRCVGTVHMLFNWSPRGTQNALHEKYVSPFWYICLFVSIRPSVTTDGQTNQEKIKVSLNWPTDACVCISCLIRYFN